MQSGNAYPQRKMLTCKTGNCYYTPHPDGVHLMYKWTNGGTSTNADGHIVMWYACAGCKGARNKDKNLPKVPNAKRNETTERWIVNPYSLDAGHYCVPFEASKEKGRQVMYERKQEIFEHGGSVAGQMKKAELKITEKYGTIPENERLSIEHHALGNKNSAATQLRRAKKRRFPTIDDIEDFDNPAKKQKLRQWTLTINAHLTGGDELLIRFYNSKFVILMSDIQIKWFKYAIDVFGDGTFKYAAKGYQQIYRIYGLFQKTQCSPLVTILSKFKDEVTYTEAFAKILEIVGIPVDDLKWKVAHFDQETGAINAFKTVFGQRVRKVKVCSFHTKQGLIRDVGSLHVKTLYNINKTFKKFVQRLGGLQLMNPAYLDIAKVYMLEEAEELANDVTMPDGIVAVAVKLVEDYFRNWVDTSLGRDFFSLYDIKRNRTTNYAEAYHSKQKLIFGETHLVLGTWIFHQREVQHADDNKLNRVMKLYDDPPAADENTLEADFNIDEAKNPRMMMNMNKR